jgi:preprotein translocase subunit Sec61beta
MLYILQLNENFNFNANKARLIITSFKEYLNRLELSPASIVYLAITVAKIKVLLLIKCSYNSINTRDLAYLFLNKIYAPL